MTALITGICGFAGRHLAAHLLSKRVQVFGTYLDPADRKLLGPLHKQVGLLHADVRNVHKMAMVLRKTQPHRVYHLAAQASVGLSLERPVMTVDVNVTGTAGLLEAVRRESPETRVLFPSSSDVYGIVRRKDVPIKETQGVAPQTPYAASKLAAEEICQMYVRSHGLEIVIARSFNHTGPGQAPGFVVPDFASQIAKLEKSRGKPRLKVGNLNARRDISDVRDIVRGYRLLAMKGRAGQVYHLGSGSAVKIKDVLGMLTEMSEKSIEIIADPKRQRPSDLPIVQADVKKVKRLTGWHAAIPLETTLTDTLEYWRTHGR
jgi:GDP-4-dehydro-6-deoxy-D-mannose reductase